MKRLVAFIAVDDVANILVCDMFSPLFSFVNKDAVLGGLGDMDNLGHIPRHTLRPRFTWLRG